MKTTGSFCFFFSPSFVWMGGKEKSKKKKSFFKDAVIAHCLNTHSIDTYTQLICMDELG